MGPKLANVYSVESWVSLRPRSPWIGPSPASWLGPQQGPPPLPAPYPPVAFPDQAGPLRTKRSQQTARTHLLGSVQPLEAAQAGGTALRWGKKEGKREPGPGSLLPHPAPHHHHHQLSLQECLAGPKVHPNGPGSSKLSPSPRRRAPTHRIAFGGAPRCCVHGEALWPGEQEPPGPPGLRS